MSVRIPKKYLKGADDAALWPLYIIGAPASVPELSGYVMKVMQDYTRITDNALLILYGNEWNKKKQQRFYMFEKENKIPGHPSKRYRYTEDEVVRLYGKAESATFDERVEKKRSQTIEKGPGRLLRASYTDFSERRGKTTKQGWFIAPDADLKWVYPLDYDPLRDIGKHNCDAKGFAALEEYNVSDIAILREHRTQLAVLLSQLDYNRSLHMDSRYFGHEWCYGVYGSHVEAKTLGEELAIRCYNAIPRQVTHNEDGRRHYIYETPESEQLRKDLTEMGTEMERKCADALRKYQLEKIDQITTEIKDLIGIVIYKYNPD